MVSSGNPATASPPNNNTSPASTSDRGQDASIAVPVTETVAAACGDDSGAHAHGTEGVHPDEMAVGASAGDDTPTAVEGDDATPSHIATSGATPSHIAASNASNVALDTAAAVRDMERDAVTASLHHSASDDPAGGNGSDQPAAATTATDGASPAAAAVEVGMIASGGGGDAEVDFIPMSSV